MGLSRLAPGNSRDASDPVPPFKHVGKRPSGSLGSHSIMMHLKAGSEQHCQEVRVREAYWVGWRETVL